MHELRDNVDGGGVPVEQQDVPTHSDGANATPEVHDLCRNLLPDHTEQDGKHKQPNLCIVSTMT
jgi:hypothetical protein